MSLRLERRLFIVLAVSCLVLGANGLRLVVKSSAGTGKSTAVQSELVRLTPAPYTTVLEETLSDATGAKRQAWRYTTAVRSDGSHVLWTDFVGRPGANDQRSGRLITLVGTEPSQTLLIETDDLRRLRSTTSGSGPRPAVRDPKLGCKLPWADGNPRGEVSNDVADQVLGYRLVRVTQQNVGSYWYAPDLGCAMLKAVITVRGQTNSRLASSATGGEPDRRLFDVSGLEEVVPSVLRRVNDKVKAARIDQKYLATRQER